MSKAKSSTPAPAITFANGRWSVDSYSTSAPNKLINHLRKRGVDVSYEEIMALATADAPVATAVTTAPEPAAENEEN